MIKTTREIVFWSNDCKLEELAPRSNKKWIEVDYVLAIILKYRKYSPTIFDELLEELELE